MTKSKQTKKALLSSVMALLLCVTMLLGTTFAWFTDTASTRVNTIQAGTLDVALKMATGWDENGVPTKWKSAEGKTLDFIKASGAAEGEAILWEPGCTYKLPELCIENTGNLALKYKVVITGINGDAELNDVIDWTINDNEDEYAVDAEMSLAADESRIFTISGKMQASAGNYYQGMSIDGISITVFAAQNTYEYDSNGNLYDKDADYLIPWDGTIDEVPAEDNGVITITSAGQLVGLMNNYSVTYRGKTINLGCDIDFGGATIPGFCVGGAGQFDAIFDGQGHTISNFKLESDSEYMTGLFGNIGVNSGSTIKNLIVTDAVVTGKTQVGVIAGAINDDAIVENCKVENCTVFGTKKVGAVVGYTLNSTVTGCSATNCTVYCADSDEAESNEIVGFINSGSTVKNNKFTNVTVVRGSTPTFVSSAAELKNAVAANTQKVNLVLTSDFTAPADWTPIDIGFYGDYLNVANLTINGNGHEISGLNAALVEKISGCCSLTISNLTVKGAAISNSTYTNGMGDGILVGYVENGSVTLNNCHISDSSITESSVAAAALIGYISNGTAINISNCSVKNTVVNGSDAAGFAGYAQYANITVSGCEVTGSAFTGKNAKKQGAYFGTVNVGTVANISNTTADTTALVGRTLSTGTVNYN